MKVGDLVAFRSKIFMGDPERYGVIIMEGPQRGHRPVSYYILFNDNAARRWVNREYLEVINESR